MLVMPKRDTRLLLLKWLVALLVPVAVFTFAWSGEEIVNQVLLSFFSPAQATFDIPTAIQAAIFSIIFYASIIALAGYLVAADSGRHSMWELWIDIFVYTLIPLFLFISLQNLIISLALCVVIWFIYIFVRGRVRSLIHYVAPPLVTAIAVLDQQQQEEMRRRALAGSFLFATLFALISLIADVAFLLSGSSFPLLLIVWVVVRTLLLPVVGYFLGKLAGRIALRRALTPESNRLDVEAEIEGIDGRVSKKSQLQSLSASRAQDEAKDFVPNDLPMRSRGAQRFYILLLVAFVLFFPVLDPILFGYGSAGRISGYGDAGYYIILALGLNIVVGFAGLLDLGYVAFFAIGAYAWGMVGSLQLQTLTGITVNPLVWGWLFWPMLLGAALIAAFWGVLLGAPTLRLRGDYLAIVTLGFGEIIPIVFLELDKYTNGVNGLVGIYSPKFFGLQWSSVTPIPYYYLVLALIALLIFVNVRLRDSRLGRAWIAIREDEIAAASSGISLTKTKLFAFGAGAFFSGVAGAYHAAKLGTVTPDTFSSSDSFVYLAMVVIGGLGSIPGVIVGAFVVYSINEFILTQLDAIAATPGNVLHILPQLIPGFAFGNIRNLIFGIILVSIMIFRPEGLIPSTRRKRELHHVDTEEVEVGALDQPPGTPEFESEVHVD